MDLDPSGSTRFFFIGSRFSENSDRIVFVCIFFTNFSMKQEHFQYFFQQFVSIYKLKKQGAGSLNFFHLDPNLGIL